MTNQDEYKKYIEHLEKAGVVILGGTPHIDIKNLLLVESTSSQSTSLRDFTTPLPTSAGEMKVTPGPLGRKKRLLLSKHSTPSPGPLGRKKGLLLSKHSTPSPIAIENHFLGGSTSPQSTFDVFLCYNSQDKPEVREIALKLKEQGLTPWLDEWELRPGFSWQELLEEQIEQIKSAAVFVGSSGLGPWQQREMRAFLDEFVNRSCPVIPVLLKDAPQKPQLPIFLKAVTWVDFRHSESNPMGRLMWGITGIKSTEQ